MSRIFINQYYKDLEERIRYGGSRNEGSVRYAFGTLLNAYCRSRNFILIDELTIKSKLNTSIRLDGVVKDALRLDWGYWEAKDEKDNLDAEIETKFKKGYPTDNIIFEDTNTAVLIQNGIESLRVNMKNPDDLDKLLNQFLDFERTEVKDFREAIASFKSDLPTILATLRDLINTQSQSNQNYIQAANNFLKVCQESINPDLKIEDIREMIIQHILTEDIFNNIFNESQFHQENNIARQLQDVIKTFFTGNIKRNTLKTIESYYSVIIRTAANIVNHQEKQKFLKVVYENFYQAYNPKAADRLGIVYTPNEIVKFMVESTDYLLNKHFNKLLGDKGVEILDPATGTGTFITEILEYLLVSDLEYKYKHEIHCNEVSILPYYIANLNIEYSYQQKTGEYLEFNNICLMDTLDHTNFTGKQMDLFSMSQENTERIKRQNERKISVIIGNPPYNANQQNENDNNKNREYSAIDKRIKDTYVKESTAQKTKVYDMYSRFYRWATDRLNEDGIIAFITNSSFINARTFDGFRQVFLKEFDYIYVIDLGGDVRKNPKLSGTTHNVFGIQTGVAITFLVKNKQNQSPCKIFYTRRPELERADEKLKFLSANKLKQLDFERVNPDKNNNWINLTDNDFDELLPVANKDTKLAKNKDDDRAIFKLFSNGVVTARDEWVFDFDKENLEKKVNFLIKIYNKEIKNQLIDNTLNDTIKWTRAVKKDFNKGIKYEFDKTKILVTIYRPFVKRKLYFAKELNEMQYQLNQIFPMGKENTVICLTIHKQIAFVVQISNCIFDNGIGSRISQCLPLYRYENETRIDNITDWGLQQFREYYNNVDPPQPPLNKGGARLEKVPQEEDYNNVDPPQPPLKKGGARKEKAPQNKGGARKEKAPQEEDYNNQDPPHPPLNKGRARKEKAPLNKEGARKEKAPLNKGGWGDQITKEDIFNYVYAVLHNPAYRQKYELNLKREFPRIPFYNDFWQWVKWGKELMELHLNYETIKPYQLKRIDKPLKDEECIPKPKLKADKKGNKLIIDEVTTLENIPATAWEYQLGNRSALEWILDQYKEKKSKDQTIATQFNNYRFADYKEQVIDLLMRVTTVSVETMKIIDQMDSV